MGQTNVWVPTGSTDVDPRLDALGFSIADNGYLLFGITDDGDTLPDLLRYDPVLETWVSMAFFPGAKRTGAVAFTIGNTAYVGLGSNTTGVLRPKRSRVSGCTSKSSAMRRPPWYTAAARPGSAVELSSAR